MANFSPTSRKNIIEALDKYFNGEELRVLCFELAIDHETIGGYRKLEFILNLISYIEKYDILEEFMSVLSRQRPMIDWSEFVALEEKSEKSLLGSIKQWLSEQIVIEDRYPTPKRQYTDRRLPRLRQILEESFTVSELDDLCFRLDIDPTFYPSSKTDRTIEMLQDLYDTDRIHELILLLKVLRPHRDFSQFTDYLEIAPEAAQQNEIIHSRSFDKDEYQPLNELKILFLGQGGVGKTSLINSLTSEINLQKHSFNESLSKTEGINIHKSQINVKKIPIQLNIWDFGGQEIYHATHQFFLTQRSLYLLVIDARIGEEQSQLEYWLKIIRSYSQNSPVIVVVNKIDEHQLQLDHRGLRIKYDNLQDFVYTSCKTSEGIDDLLKSIQEVIIGIPHIQDKIPGSWLIVKDKLDNMKRDFISYEQFVDLCESEDIKEEESQKALVKTLHNLGTVLNFSDDRRLEDTNVLNPRWVTDAIYAIISFLSESRTNGILDINQLKKILDRSRYPSRKHLFIINLMEKFELCYSLGDDQYLIPGLLQKEEPILEWKFSECLAFQYHFDVLPQSVITRFIVGTHEYIHEHLCWRNGVVLKYESNQAIIKADSEEKKIYIWINGAIHSRRNLLSIIRANLKRICSSFVAMDIKQVVPIPTHPATFIPYNDLLALLNHGYEEHFYPPVAKVIRVRELLNGIELPQERSLPELMERMKSRLSMKDVEDLIFYLNLNIDDISRETRDETIRELLLHLDRRGRISELIRIGMEKFSHVDW